MCFLIDTTKDNDHDVRLSRGKKNNLSEYGFMPQVLCDTEQIDSRSAVALGCPLGKIAYHEITMDYISHHSTLFHPPVPRLIHLITTRIVALIAMDSSVSRGGSWRSVGMPFAITISKTAAITTIHLVLEWPTAHMTPGGDANLSPQ